MDLKQAIKGLDAFPRAEEHLLQKTRSGALVSVFGLAIMATLFWHELNYYLTTHTIHQMAVDLKRGETLPIHINMTFPSLPCDVLMLDAFDMSGKREVDLDTSIWKLRLNSYGHIIGTEYLSDLVEKEHETHKHNHTDHDKDDDKGSEKPHLNGLDAAAQNMIKKVKQAMENREGCRVYGVLDVQKVAGNFLISVHVAAKMILEGSNHVNVSLIIHDLSFGSKYPGIHNPLDGTIRILHNTSGTFKYNIKIVPTEYRYISKEVLLTNQFSVTEYYSPRVGWCQHIYGLPPALSHLRSSSVGYFCRPICAAVYFLYDLSPITVTIKEERRSFLHFITRLCAVLGGTFALIGMLDRWMYRLVEALINPKNSRSAMR